MSLLSSISSTDVVKRDFDLDLARFFRVADADLHDLRVGVLRFLHYLVDSLSDDAEPEQADFDFAHMLLVY